MGLLSAVGICGLHDIVIIYYSDRQRHATAEQRSRSRARVAGFFAESGRGEVAGAMLTRVGTGGCTQRPRYVKSFRKIRR